MIGKYNKSVILTYAGVCISIAGINLSLRGNIPAAVICLVFAGICDLFDGVIARRCKRDEEEKQFGVQIDSLADMISFSAFPAVIMISMDSGMIPTIISMFYVLCGIIRLAWFNMKTASAEGTGKYYIGLPVTYSALIFPVLWLLNGIIPDAVFAIVFMAAYVITAVMFILNVKIPKPRGIWYAVFGILAVTVTAVTIFKDIL